METNTPDFTITKNIQNYLYLDENNKKWTIPQGIMFKKINIEKIYDYNDIVNYELIEDGNSVSKGGIGRAIVGGVLFGGVGAIVGGSTGHKHKQTCTKLQIKITLNNINNPVEYITLIKSETKKSSLLYKTSINIVQEILSILEIICESNKNDYNDNKSDNKISSNIDEIKKYKQLLDCGVITSQEFENKKKQLLDL